MFFKVFTILQLNREHAFRLNLVLQAIVRALKRLAQSWNTDVHWFNRNLYIIYSNQQHSELSLLVICFINTCCICAGSLFRSALHLARFLWLSLIMYLSSISSWHARFEYLEPVNSCSFHMPPLYVMCYEDYETQKHEHSFQPLEDSIKPGDIFIFIVSSNVTL